MSSATAGAAGNLLIADNGNSRVRVAAESAGTFYGQPMTAGNIYTIAGTGTAGFSGDGGPATGAELSTPAAVRLDGAGNLLIADTYNGRARVVAESNGTFYGQPMTAGNIYSVAAGEVTLPGGVAAGPTGNLLIADSYGNRIREVKG